MTPKIVLITFSLVSIRCLLITKLEFKIYLKAMMTRKVQEYLSTLNIVTDEDELREMSQACEAGQGSGMTFHINLRFPEHC